MTGTKSGFVHCTTNSLVVVVLVLAVAVWTTCPIVTALECGQRLTKDCTGKDFDYPESKNNLMAQSNLWTRRSGLYQVTAYDYSATYIGNGEIEIGDRTWDGFPYTGYINMTVDKTRFYHHGYFMQQNLITKEGRAWYRDLYGHSQSFGEVRDTLKMGDAVLLSERFEGRKQGFFDYSRGNAIPTDSSRIMDVGDYRSMRRTKAKVPNDESGEILIWETLACQEQSDCSTLYFTEERFDEFGNRTSFTSGTYTKQNSVQWTQGIADAYTTYDIAREDQKAVPNGCLVDVFCISEKEWTESADPATQDPPEEDGELRNGVIACFVIMGFIVMVGGVFFLWNVISKATESRYKTAFISRVCEDISLYKAMKEITPENLTREFKFIDKDDKGHITKGELLNFLLSTKAQPIPDRDFSELWRRMDLNHNGVVTYTEFCAFIADCYGEHSMLRNQIVIQAKKAAQANH